MAYATGVFSVLTVVEDEYEDRLSHCMTFY